MRGVGHGLNLAVGFDARLASPVAARSGDVRRPPILVRMAFPQKPVLAHSEFRPIGEIEAGRCTL